MQNCLIRQIIFSVFIFFCSQILFADSFSVQGSSIEQNGINKVWRGANAMHVFGGSSNDMNAWNADLVREFIGDVKNTPISGWATYVNGKWLHPLEKYIANNRANGKVTILTPFGWDGVSLTGKNPSQQIFYNEYKAKMREWANYIKNQPDVWIEVWNEPYMWDNSNYPLDHSLWLSDMIDLVDNIRATGCNNIILVPGNMQGQGEAPILAKADLLVKERINIVFDLHAYEKWLDKVSYSTIENRLQKLKELNVAVMFGELAPMNAGVLMNPSDFLKAVQRKNISTAAWLWKYNSADRDALFDSAGAVNNTNNNNWGSQYTTHLLEPHTFNASDGKNAGLVGDKDINTYWTSEGNQKAGQSITIGFGLAKIWNHVRVDMGNQPYQYPYSFKVLSSDDGINWNEVTSRMGNPFITEFWVSTQTSKWMRITLIETPSNFASPWSIAEITVDNKNVF